MPRKKTLFIIFVFLLLTCFGGQNKRTVFAGVSDNVSGWAWNSNVGWISFNCTGDVDCSPDYGVKIDTATGNFSGYAWNDNVGWISFNRCGTDNNCGTIDGDTGAPPQNPYSAGLGPIAVVNISTGIVTGWAKILSLGDDGWIRLDHAQANPVTANVAAGELEGWAYNEGSGGTGIGWISFNCLNEGICGTSNYKVLAALNIPPTISETTAPNLGSNDQICAKNSVLTADLKWKYNDTSGLDGTAYQIVVSGSDGNSFDTGKCLKASGVSGNCIIDFGANPNQFCLQENSYCTYTLNSTIFPQMNYDVHYSWSVTVWDNLDLSTTFAYDSILDTNNDDGNNSTFTTYKSEFPDPDDFIWLPRDFNAGENILFDSKTRAKYYTGGTENDCTDLTCDWEWSDPNTAAPNISFSPPLSDFASTTIVNFTAPLATQLQLEVTDISDGKNYKCSTTTSAFEVKQKLPDWIETKR